MTNHSKSNPLCPACGSDSAPAVHTHFAKFSTRQIAHLVYSWACVQCCVNWEDERSSLSTRLALGRALALSRAVSAA
jgi:hypothetical protein